MLEESWKRNPEGVILEEEPWKRNTQTRILEQGSWRRNPAGGILEESLGEESWRIPQAGILEEESQRRKPGGRTLEEGPQKGLWGHLQKALEGHPGVLWRHLGFPSSHQDHFLGSEEKCAETIVFFCRKWRDRPFRLHGSEATCTKCRACT